MSKTAVIYWSGTGNTEAMAKYVLEGAKEVNADTEFFHVSEISAEDAASYDILIMGCPANGSEELEEGEFEPFFDELESKLAGKKAALFGSYGWGDGEWMRTWESRIKDAGAKLVSESVIANETPDDAAAEQCKKLGRTAAAH